MWSFLIKPIVDTVGGIVQNFQKRKILKAEGKLEIQKAKTKRKVRELEGDIDYNVEAQKGMASSWKDEFITIVLWGSFLAMFIPQLQPHISNGLAFFKSNAPWWYEYCLVGTVVASFGLKGWKFWETKKMLTGGNGE